MSTYTTLNVTIKKALSCYILDQLDCEDDIDGIIKYNAGNVITIPSIDELEAFMDNKLESRLYNCILVDSDNTNNNDDIVW